MNKEMCNSILIFQGPMKDLLSSFSFQLPLFPPSFPIFSLLLPRVGDIVGSGRPKFRSHLECSQTLGTEPSPVRGESYETAIQVPFIKMSVSRKHFFPLFLPHVNQRGRLRLHSLGLGLFEHLGTCAETNTTFDVIQCKTQGKDNDQLNYMDNELSIKLKS